MSVDVALLFQGNRPMATLNADDLKTYTAQQVASLADVDFHSVRDEGFRRQSAAEKKLGKLRKQIAAAERELEESATIINAAFAARQTAN